MIKICETVANDIDMILIELLYLVVVLVLTTKTLVVASATRIFC